MCICTKILKKKKMSERMKNIKYLQNWYFKNAAIAIEVFPCCVFSFYLFKLEKSNNYEGTYNIYNDYLIKQYKPKIQVICDWKINLSEVNCYAMITLYHKKHL